MAACVSPPEVPPIEEDTVDDGVLIPPTWFDDTVVFLDLHNQQYEGEDNIRVRVTFSDDDDPPVPWYLMGRLYDEEGHRVQSAGFGLIGAGAHRETVVLRANGEEMAIGPHDRPLYETIGDAVEDVVPGGLSTQAEADWVFEVPSGTHHLMIIMRGVKGNLEVNSLNDSAGSLEPGNLTVDPDMFIEQRTLHDEWDHVETEVRVGSELDWLIDAQSAAEIRYPFNSIQVRGTGAYKELEIQYPDEDTCSYSGPPSTPDWADARHVPLGNLGVFGKAMLTDSHITNGLVFSLTQLPLEAPSEPECITDLFHGESKSTCGSGMWRAVQRAWTYEDYKGEIGC